MKFLQRFWFALRSIFRMHFSIPSLVTFAVVFALVYHFLARDLVAYLSTLLNAWYDPTSIWHPFVVGVAATIVTTAIFALAGVLFLDWYNKCRLTGKYNAYELDAQTNTWTDWGVVTISYHPFASTTHHTPVRLRLTFDQGGEELVLEGDGIIIDNRYLAGHYAEVSKPERRRSGSFTYEISGQGNEWTGLFVSISPEHSSPTVGQARWVRQ